MEHDQSWKPLVSIGIVLVVVIGPLSSGARLPCLPTGKIWPCASLWGRDHKATISSSLAQGKPVYYQVRVFCLCFTHEHKPTTSWATRAYKSEGSPKLTANPFENQFL